VAVSVRSGAARLALFSLPATVLALVLAMLATEVWVRWQWDPRRGQPGFYASDPARGQRLRENYRGWFAGVPVAINRLGLRDPREYELVKRPNTFRILVLGDSVTFGHGSVYEYTYPYLTEQKLRAWRPDVDWQVWNAAVPGYNTSQELAQLLEVGPRFQPDLVVVGFFDNDLIDNKPILAPTAAARVWSGMLSAARRHVYSLELYTRIYLQLAWHLSASNEYRLRVEHLADDDALTSARTRATRSAEQALTPYEWLSDEQVRNVRCESGMKPDRGVIDALQREPGYGGWLDAVRGFQQLHGQRRYRIAFFLNVMPQVCPNGDAFYGSTAMLNDFFLRILSDGTPAVSCHDAFLHVRPSQMPNATAHSTGNSNLVKSDVLFQFLRDRVLPAALPAALRARAAS
jgi:hypothetical protein